ncbi:histidine phosphatase family protein [Amycolatopsis sp. NPDC051102]|uniref:histidine phosphatase family protein n=1 Tax=Amycolatopsis sp. NPDC051102 TaxID=3155163 RepID=UPI003444941D
MTTDFGNATAPSRRAGRPAASATLTEICLVRHGAYEATDRGHAPDGRWDPPLSEAGREQADAVGTRLAAFGWDHLLCSHLRRAGATADRIGAACGLRPAADHAWAEFHRGTLEDAIPGRHPDHERRWRDGAWESWPGGEHRRDFRARVLGALRRCPEGARTIVVTHGGVINEVLCALLGSPARTLFRLDLTGITRIGLDDGHAVVGCVNDTWHLEDSLSMPLTVFSSKGALR